MSKPINTSGMHCPLWRKPCVKVCHTCELYEHLRGKHPQTGQDMDTWICAYRAHTYLQTEHTMASRQVHASIDELRKEVRRSHDTAMAGAIAHINAQVLGTAKPVPLASNAPKLLGGQDAVE